MRTLVRATLVAALLCPSLASAQVSTADKTTATQLYDDAEKLATGNVSDACPKYAKMQRRNTIPTPR